MRTRRPRPPAGPAAVEYRRAYERGWRYSLTSPAPTLDYLDSKRAPSAEYDGYLDAATGRAKWHIPNCPGHLTCQCPEGG